MLEALSSKKKKVMQHLWEANRMKRGREKRKEVGSSLEKQTLVGGAGGLQAVDLF